MKWNKFDLIESSVSAMESALDFAMTGNKYMAGFCIGKAETLAQYLSDEYDMDINDHMRYKFLKFRLKEFLDASK